MKLPDDTRIRAPAIGEFCDAQRKQRLDTAPHLAARFEDAVHRLGVGNAQAERIATLDILLREYRLDLRP